MIPGWFDCPRRAAAKAFYKDIEAAGYTLRKTPASIGAIVGTSVHFGAEEMLRGKILTGNLTPTQDCIDMSIEKMREEIQPGAIWDGTTTTKNEAEKQIKIMVVAYAIEIAPKIQPGELEVQRSGLIGTKIKLTGRSDVETITDDLRDTKTGAVIRPHHGQVGGYSLLRYNATKRPTRSIIVDYIPRVSTKKIYPGTQCIEYNPTLCEHVAYQTIGHIARSVDTFRKTQNPWAFGCNAMSMLCSEKYCPAYKTPFCEVRND